jgi:hypothetical protein
MDAVGERRLARPFHPQALEVDVRHHQIPAAPEAFALGQQGAVLGHQQLAGKHQVGGRLVHAGVGVRVGAQPAAGLHLEQLAPVLGLHHQLVGGGKAEDHGGPGQSVQAAGRHRHPEVLADLGGQRDPGLALQGEEQVRTKGDAGAEKAHAVASGLAHRRKPALLVELAVAGKVGLGDDAQDPTALDQDRTVEELVLGVDRHPHGQHHRLAGGLGQQAAQSPLGPADQRLQAEEEIARGVAGEAQLGEDDDLGAAALRLGHRPQHLADVGLGIANRDLGCGGGEAEETEGGSGHIG